MTLADAVFGEFYAGEDTGIVLAGGDPGAVTAAVDEALDQIGQDEHHGYLNPQHPVVVLHLIERGAVGLHEDVAVGHPSAGHTVTHEPPEPRHQVAGP